MPAQALNVPHCPVSCTPARRSFCAPAASIHGRALRALRCKSFRPRCCSCCRSSCHAASAAVRRPRQRPRSKRFGPAQSKSTGRQAQRLHAQCAASHLVAGRAPAAGGLTGGRQAAQGRRRCAALPAAAGSAQEEQRTTALQKSSTRPQRGGRLWKSSAQSVLQCCSRAAHGSLRPG